MGPVILLTLGFQFLLDSMGVIRFGRTLPLAAGGHRPGKDFPEYGGPGPAADRRNQRMPFIREFTASR